MSERRVWATLSLPRGVRGNAPDGWEQTARLAAVPRVGEEIDYYENLYFVEAVRWTADADCTSQEPGVVVVLR